MFLGVCRGLADWTDYPVRYFRIALIASAFFFFWITLPTYLAAAVLMPVKRPEGYDSEGFRENMDDLRDDVRDFVRREYGDFRRAFFKRERNKSADESFGEKKA
jgi:phage shock protein PspC (stress-responsive transcriptional regulator)